MIMENDICIDRVKFVFTGNEKSGMERMDITNQKKVIYEASKNSSYYAAAEAKADKTQEDCKRLLMKIESLNDYDIENLKKKGESLLQQIELKERTFDQLKCVLDMVTTITLYILFKKSFDLLLIYSYILFQFLFIIMIITIIIYNKGCILCQC
jgi:hypothetical protein